ncbi:MAG: MBL fold metallo-hydrolase [Albidovulum sp.]
MLQHLRILEPHPGILAFYDGRVDGHRFIKGPNWVDGGAITLGIASYAVISGSHALIYDTHVSVAHAGFIKETLTAHGVTHFTVVLSHWHLDHVAGTEVFADCEIIANNKTFAHLSEKRADIEAGALEGPPAISPLVLPNQMFDARKTVNIGSLSVEVIEANIHSDDATVVWIKELGILLAGDTMEDTVTYVDEPQNFATHLADLDRLAALDAQFILPNHGDPDIIASGGYGSGLIKAQKQYIRTLERCRQELDLREKPLEDLISEPLSMGWVKLFEPYREIHAENLERVVALDT